MAYLSAALGIDTLIYRYIRQSVPAKGETQPRMDPSTAIAIERLSQKVRREAHRMKGFVRFVQTGEQVYLALINPRYDVLPLIRRHFENRYADQQWIIYDTERGSGFFYDLESTREVRLPAESLPLPTTACRPTEQRYRQLWKRYFESVNVPQRNNPKAHLRQLSRRYWKYLPEKSENGVEGL